jgi:thioesterase domain-containing protein
VAYVIARHRVAVSTAGLVPRRGLDQYDLFVAINADMVDAYRPATTLDAPLLLVRCVPDERAEPGTSDQSVLEARSRWDFGWSDHVMGPITVVDLPGDHLGLVRQPVVERVGAAIASALG